MRVRFTPLALGQVERRKRWWRDNRPKAPNLFDYELAQALEQLDNSRESFPVFTERSGRVIRRCLMPKTRCHIYFEVLSSDVLVHALSGAQRRRSPRFKLQDGP